ncbi:MAG: amidase [Pseudomonadota bacterium]
MTVAPHRLGALEAALRIDAGTLTAVALVASCLERIAEREPAVGAWEHLDPEAALDRARALDRTPRRGPLHGLPMAVKDIVDVAGMPTGMGSPIHAGAPPAGADAACVALAQARGALPLGKTVTTEFANFHPGKTRNPHALDHTPGGSSSGSAAAVADFMVPLAIGTQTAGSIIRPAAYCGVAGFKPSFGLIPRAGVKPLADSLDTVGSFGRSVADAALLAAALSGWDDLILPAEPPAGPPRLAFCRTAHWDRAQPEAQAAFEAARLAAARAGAGVRVLTLPSDFDALADAQAAIQAVETARALAWERLARGQLLSDRLRDQIDAAAAIPLTRYVDTVEMVRACRTRLPDLTAGVDAIVAPSAAGAAPEGLAATGDPLFNRAWTAVHAPVVHVPVPSGDALPVGVSVVGRFGADPVALGVAQWLEQALAP